MKRDVRILCVLMLVFAAVTARADDPWAKIGVEVDQIAFDNGHDWMEYSKMEKAIYVRGFLTASLAAATYLRDVGEPVHQRQLHITELVGRVMHYVDVIYENPKDRDYTLWTTVYFVVGKDWWNQKECPTGEWNRYEEVDY